MCLAHCASLTMNSCIGSLGFGEQLMNEVELAIKECSAMRLQNLLEENKPSKSQINYRNLLHQAAWLGHASCVQLLLDYGVEPDRPHTSNGCTPLHLAHFCTIEDRDCCKTIQMLVGAGADINNPGSRRCGKLPLGHAIQHQRAESVQALLCKGCHVNLNSIMLAMDIGNFAIFEMLLIHGGSCGPKLEDNPYWGKVLQRFIQLPLKPRDLSKQMLRLIIRATLTKSEKEDSSQGSSENPESQTSCENSVPERREVATNSMAGQEVRRMLKNPLHKQLALILLDGLLKNGFPLNKNLAILAARNGFDRQILKACLLHPRSLRDICASILRSVLSLANGNVYHGLELIRMPRLLQNFVLLSDLH